MAATRSDPSCVISDCRFETLNRFSKQYLFSNNSNSMVCVAVIAVASELVVKIILLLNLQFAFARWQC